LQASPQYIFTTRSRISTILIVRLIDIGHSLLSGLIAYSSCKSVCQELVEAIDTRTRLALDGSQVYIR
jgi:hypothetical protein